MKALFKSIGLFSSVLCLVLVFSGASESLAKGPDTAMKAGESALNTPGGMHRGNPRAPRKLVTAPRSAEISLDGARSIHINAQVGMLEIKGEAGVDVVQVSGRASALSPALLEDIRLSASRKDNTIRILGETPGDIPRAKTDIPDMKGLDKGRFHNQQQLPEEPDAFLDLSVTVPQDIPLEVNTVWGDVKVTSTASLALTVNRGNIVLTDLSGDLRLSVANGEIQIARVAGEVAVTKGLGEMVIHTVGGGVTVQKNPFGEMRIVGVKKNVRIVSDGIGDILVKSVDGDLIVEDDAGGDIQRKEIEGNVRIPEPGPPKHVREEMKKKKTKQD